MRRGLTAAIVCGALALVTPTHAAAQDTIPSVPPLFFSFRIMVGLGFLMLFLIAASSETIDSASR